MNVSSTLVTQPLTLSPEEAIAFFIIDPHNESSAVRLYSIRVMPSLIGLSEPCSEVMFPFKPKYFYPKGSELNITMIYDPDKRITKICTQKLQRAVQGIALLEIGESFPINIYEIGQNPSYFEYQNLEEKNERAGIAKISFINNEDKEVRFVGNYSFTITSRTRFNQTTDITFLSYLEKNNETKRCILSTFRFLPHENTTSDSLPCITPIFEGSILKLNCIYIEETIPSKSQKDFYIAYFPDACN